VASQLHHGETGGGGGGGGGGGDDDEGRKEKKKNRREEEEKKKKKIERRRRRGDEEGGRGGGRTTKKKKKKNPTNSNSSFQEPQGLNVWLSSVQQRGKESEERGRTFLLLLLFFWGEGGRWQKPSATRSAINYRWRMMLALFLSVMSCTCKLQNILQSHHRPLIPPSPHPPISLSPASKAIHLHCSGG